MYTCAHVCMHTHTDTEDRQTHTQLKKNKTTKQRLVIVVQVFNSTNQKAEAGGSLHLRPAYSLSQTPRQPEYIVSQDLFQKKRNKNQTNKQNGEQQLCNDSGV